MIIPRHWQGIFFVISGAIPGSLHRSFIDERTSKFVQTSVFIETKA
jgi:hypothetical protein